MGQSGSCNCMSKLEKGADGRGRNRSGEAMVSQPTLLTSGVSSSLEEKHSFRSQSMSEQCFSTVQMQQHQQHQQLYAQSLSQVPQGYPFQQQRLHQTSTPFPYNATTESVAVTPRVQHGSSFPTLNQAQHQPLHEPLASSPQPSYQTSSSSRFQVLPHTVPLAAGVDRVDPVIVQQLVKSGHCILVDVRGEDRAAGIIEGSVHVPAIDAVPFSSKIQDCVRQWGNQPLVIFHCQYSAHRAPQCANLYREQAPEHQRVAILDGGFRGWESLGLPVQQGKQGICCQQNSNMYALQQGMQFAIQQRTR